MRRDQVVRRLKPPAGALADGAVADGGLKAAGHVAPVARAFGVETGVAQVAGTPDVAAQQLAIDHRGATDASAQGEQDDVLHAPGRPEPDFAQERCMGIVNYGNGPPGSEPTCPS